MTYTTNPAYNTNDTPSQPGAFDAEPYLDARQAERTTFAACSGPFRQGRNPCPSPEACQVSVDAEEFGASAWFWGVLAIAMVVFVFLGTAALNYILTRLA
jgi:hypothetical protein